MKEERIAIIGLGYVGLPLACEFGKKFPTLGYDKDKNRITPLQNDPKQRETESLDSLDSLHWTH